MTHRPAPDLARPDGPPDPSALACLTLLLPRALEATVLDWLLARPETDLEFGVHEVAAHGPLVPLTDREELVRGCARRIEISLIASRERVLGLVPPLRDLLRGSQGGWWVTPVEGFGNFATSPLPGDAPADATSDHAAGVPA